MTPQQIIAALRAARAEAEKQRKLIHEERVEKASQGRLWTNGQCAAWRDYEAALQKLDDVRNSFGV